VLRLRESKLIANSIFSQSVLRNALNFSSTVLYPPVASPLRAKARSAGEELIVACGRFSPEKNFDVVLDVANKVRRARFVILGVPSGAISRGYYGHLVALKKSLNLANVSILLSSQDLMMSYYSRGAIFLNATVDESFGMSVVEAMAHGLVPVVNRSGGPWLDILGRKDGDVGFSFRTADECASRIENLLDGQDELASISTRARQRAGAFSENNFREGIARELEQALATKGYSASGSITLDRKN
jgi:glycosyltransferase involved in cell wall biosynthesis